MIKTAPRLRSLAPVFYVLAISTTLGASALAQQAAPQMPPPAVIVEKVAAREISNANRFTARVEAIAVGDIRARVSGYLRTVAFSDGQAVKAGDLLFQIEPDQLYAAATAARAQVARAQASRGAAERTLNRNRELFGRNTVSRAVLDDAQAAFDVANADVQVAQAALDTADLNLSYTQLRSPIDGKAGRAARTAGNLVGPETGTLVRVVSLDPIRVAFSMTEGFFVTLRQTVASGGALPDAASLKLTLALPNGTAYDQPGKIEFIENEVDPQTGSVVARAVFPNPASVLVPGQFVTLNIEAQKAPVLPVVPQTAVLQDREGRFVFVLGADNKVALKRIETGPRIEGGWAVTSGLDGGEEVVVEGAQRLADGMAVQPAQGQGASQ